MQEREIMKAATPIINYLDNLEIPIEIRKEHSMWLVDLKQQVRAWYEKDYGVCYEQKQKANREQYVDAFLLFLTTNGICTISHGIISGIGKMSSERMALNFGKPSQSKKGTFFAGRSNRMKA